MASLSCNAFEAHATALLEADVEPGLLSALEAHRAACESCARLLEELDALARAAASLPPLAPSRDLWAGIESRIATPALPLARPPVPHPRHQRGDMGRRGRGVAMHVNWLTAAAVVLAVGAGAVYRFAGAPTAVVATADHGTGDSLAGGLMGPGGARGSAETVATSPEPAPPTSNTMREPAATGRARLASSGGVDALTRSGAPDVAGAYATDLAHLRGELDARRSTLDSSTVRILETNMTIIDRAIRESRAALAADPASAFLNQQLSDAMADKLELMRTAIQLTSGS